MNDAIIRRITSTTLRRRVALAGLRRGVFRLRSGATSDRYFDKYRVEANPELLRPLAKQLCRLLPETAELLAGLELGGVPLAVAMSLTHDEAIQVAFIRAAPKPYGTRQQIEGPDVWGVNVCLVEDVVTTGGAVAEAARVVRLAGGMVTTAVCLVVRDQTAIDWLAIEHGIALRAVYTLAELEAAAPVASTSSAESS